MSNWFRAVSITCVSAATIAVWVVTIQAEWNLGGWSQPGSHARSAVSGFISVILGALISAACIHFGARWKSHHLAAVGIVSAIMAAVFLVFTTFCMGM